MFTGSLSKKFIDMNRPGKVLTSLAAAYVAFKVMSIKPIRNYLLSAVLDTAYYMIKKRLKS